jgi:hypothetical protein
VKTKNLAAFGLAVTLVVGSACATSYQKMGMTGGFEEQKVTEDTYLVHFMANAYTRPDRVSVYILYRCAELTVEKGFDYFVRLNETNQAGEESAGFIGTVHKPGLTEMIRMGKGPRPVDNPNAFDAREVMKNLGPAVKTAS